MTRYFDDDDVGNNIEGYSDAADLLAEKFNEHVISMGDFNAVIEADELVDLLKQVALPRELSELMANDFTRGMLMERVITFVAGMHLDDEDEE